MRVLVTGGSGFLGSHVVERLTAEGLEPMVAAHRDYDLTRAEDVARLFGDTQPDLVFHLAAEVGGIGANRMSPGRFWYANLLMSAHVLEASRLADVDKLVLVGTVCSYPKLASVPFREDEIWEGYPEETNAPYGVAKRATLVGSQAYRQQYGLNSINLVLVNLYGPGDNFDPETSHVIPALIRKMVEAKAQGSERVVLWGDGSPTREFLYVTDCAEALWLGATRYDGDRPVNIGSGMEISIRDLAQLVAEITGFQGEIAWDASKPNGQPRRCLDVSQARELFGFQASTPLRDGLQKTIEWYLETSGAGALV